MSAAVDHDHDDGHGHESGPGYGTFQGYATGLVIAALISAAAFLLVTVGGLGGKDVTTLLLIALSVARIVTHMIYFLRVKPNLEEGWTVIALVFTAIIVVIVMFGSTWVMYHLDADTMPKIVHGAM